MEFRPFTRLPPELRRLIWYHALPHDPGQAFFYYKTGCWEPTFLTDNENTDDPNDPEILQTYHHDLLNPIHFEPTLLFVNGEARDVTRKWLQRRQHVVTCQSQDNQSVIFACRFDIDRDCLFISHDIWVEFSNEAIDRAFAPDMIDKIHTFSPAQIKYLALHIRTFQSKRMDELAALLVCSKCLEAAIQSVHANRIRWQEEFYPRLQELWIVVGSVPEPLFIPGFKHEICRRWEIDPAGNEFVCEQVYNSRNAHEQAASDPAIPLRDLHNGMKATMDLALTSQALKNLVIRPVVAVRR